MKPTGPTPSARRSAAGGRRLLAVVVGLSLLASALVGVVGPSGTASAAPVTYTGAGSTWTIGVIGDSAWAGIRWNNGFAPLRRFNFRADLESCRRTLVASCRGREGYAPTTTLGAMRAGAGRWGAVLVIATGYNDPGTVFASSVDAVMNEAIAQQIYRVVWMTMRNADVTYVSPGFVSSATTFRDNNRILLQKQAQYGGRLVIADWASYSAGQPWFTSDGIHLTTAGAPQAAQFIADSAARALSAVTPAPPSAPPAPNTWVNVTQGDSGERVIIVQQYLARAGIAIFGGADGVFGPYTADAVREFQNRVGLPATGVVDKATAVELGLWYRDGSTPVRTAPRWVNVGPGDSGMRVAIVQHYLRRKGITLTGDTDGVYRSATIDAVRLFQARNGLPVTGVVDRATAVKLGLWPATDPPAPPANDWVNVAPGDAGMRVAIVHKYLRNAGIPVNGDYDGRYGTVTTNAVRAFQTRRGLPVTGIVDKATAIALGLWRASTAAAAAAPAVATMSVLAAPAVEETVPVETVRVETAPAETAPVAEESVETVPDETAPAETAPVATEPVVTEPVETEPVETEPVAAATSSVIGDLVWLDADGDGRQGDDEQGIEGMVVRLLDAGGARLAETATDYTGEYVFAGLPAGSYLVELVVPEGYDVTTLRTGSDDEVDSDVDPASRIVTDTEVTVYARVDVDGTVEDLDVDAGLIAVAAPADRPSPSRSPRPNRPPRWSRPRRRRPPRLRRRRRRRPPRHPRRPRRRPRPLGPPRRLRQPRRPSLPPSPQKPPRRAADPPPGALRRE